MGSARAEALAHIDQLYDSKTLIFSDLSFDPTYGEVLAERFGPDRVIGVKISNSGDGTNLDLMRVKNGALRIYTVGRSYLLDLLLRELHNGKVRIRDRQDSRRAYEQLSALEMDYRQTGVVYQCPSGHHDDLAISCAILVWAALHPHLETWIRIFEPRTVQKRPSSGWGAHV